MKYFVTVSFLVFATNAAAQQARQPADFAVGSSRSLWAQVTANITKAAEQMPEKDYAFRPTHEVRTFGQMIGHVAGAQNLICASALGEKSGSEDEIEKSVTTKAGLIAALRTSTEYCARAYAQSDVASTVETMLFGGKSTRFSALMLNTMHNAEHYGNLVTYLRIRGMVPPSSQPPPPRS
ncbi:MAG TPA: DinB family protein [Gemmatimonadaceae bacterium]|nr:DinB family protein [Gemmatimonadaceae bacterium]